MRILLGVLLISLIACALPRTPAKEKEGYSTDEESRRQHYLEEFTSEARSPLKAADTSMVDFYPAGYFLPGFSTFKPTPEAQPFDLRLPTAVSPGNTGNTAN